MRLPRWTAKLGASSSAAAIRWAARFSNTIDHDACSDLIQKPAKEVLRTKPKAGLSNGDRPSHKDYRIRSKLPLNFLFAAYTFIKLKCPGSILIFKKSSRSFLSSIPLKRYWKLLFDIHLLERLRYGYKIYAYWFKSCRLRPRLSMNWKSGGLVGLASFCFLLD